MGFLALEKYFLHFLGDLNMYCDLFLFWQESHPFFSMQRLLAKTVGKYGNLFALAPLRLETI